MDDPDARIPGGATRLTDHELHGHVIRLARSVELPDPFGFDAFAASLNATRERGVLISSLPGLHASGRSGLYVRFRDEGALDSIAYEKHTSPLHQLLIIFHEVAHILWREAGLAEPGSDLLELRCDDPTEERAAELIATLLAARVGVPPDPPPETALPPGLLDSIGRHERR
jgi:hypothetical protein